MNAAITRQISIAHSRSRQKGVSTEGGVWESAAPVSHRWLFSEGEKEEQHGAKVQEECRTAEVEATEPGDVV